MIWQLFSRGRKKNRDTIKVELTMDVDIDKADEVLETAKKKLEETKAKTPEIAKAVASARRVHYRVDNFTEEIKHSFGRIDHG